MEQRIAAVPGKVDEKMRPGHKEAKAPDGRGTWKPGYQRRKTLPAVNSRTEVMAKTLSSHRRMTSPAMGVMGPLQDFRQPNTSTSASYRIFVSRDDSKPSHVEDHDFAEDALGEFEQEFRRLAGLPPRLPTPPKWVPPWAQSTAQAKPRLLSVAPITGDALPRSPLQMRHQVDEKDMLSQVLSSLLPAGPSRRLRLPRIARDQDVLSNCTASPPASPFGGSPTSSTLRVSEDEDRKRGEVLAFCGTLVTRFGNTTRAFRAMKQAAQMARCPASRKASTNGLEPLSKSEFEWSVTSLLHHGNRRLASRLFAALESGYAEIPPASLSQNLDWVEDLSSLFQLRQNLLDRFGSFTEVEEALRWATLSGFEDSQDSPRALPTPLACSVSRKAFLEALAPLGISESQAVHLFLILDVAGKGTIEMSQFVHALEEIPAELTWRDLRQRLLAQKGTMADALRCLEGDLEPSKSELAGTVARSEIPGFELTKGSCGALRSSLRAAATAISLQDFWQRVVTEWPEVAEAAKAAAKRKEEAPSALRRLGELLSELLPPELQETQSSGAEDSKALLPSLSFEMFDALAEHVDVSRENARELFHCIATDAHVSDSEGKTGEEAQHPATSSVFLEEFADQLSMWAEGLEPKGSKRVRATERVRQVVGPVRAAISALKAELQPGTGSEVSEPLPESDSKDPPRIKARRMSKLPWCAYYRCRPA